MFPAFTSCLWPHIGAFFNACSIVYISLNPVPNSAFRKHFEDALSLNIEAEVKDYLNRLWFDHPDTFDTEDYYEDFMSFVNQHFRMVWVYTDMDD